jgi:hypothetical protein
MQAPSCILSEIPVSNPERRGGRVLPTADPSPGKVEGAFKDTGAECTGGSHIHENIDCAEIFGFRGDGLSKGEVGDTAVFEV